MVREIQRRLHGVGQRYRVHQRAAGIAAVMGVIDASGFDDQEEAARIVVQLVNGERRHLRQRGLARWVLAAIGLELHVRGLEQAEHRPRRGRRKAHREPARLQT